MQQKSIKRNSIFSILKTGSSILFPLITFPYISRVLLTENVGKINFGLSIVSYFTLIASLGITTYAIRECSGVRDDKEKLSETASQIFSINIITTIAAYILLAITLLFCRKLDSYRILIIIQSLTIIATTLGADWINLAMEDFKYITLRTVAFQFLSLILMFIFVHKPEDYIKYAVVSLVSSAGASVTNIWYRRKYCKVSFTMDIKWKQHMMPIIYLFVMVLAQTIFNSVDSTMLGLIKGDYEVGIYSIAHKIMNIISQVVGSLLWVIMPRMSYYFIEKNYKEINKLLRKVLGFNLLFGLPCAVGVSVIAEDIIKVVAGQAFMEASIVLKILMLGFIFSLIGGNFLGNAVLLPSKREKDYMIVCCITAIVNVIGNYIFIPFFGAKAAAGVTAICSFIMLILLFFRINKEVKIKKIEKLMFAPIVGCVGIIMVCFICKEIDNLWIRILISLFSSIVIYFIVQILMKNELVFEILSIVRKKLKNMYDKL